MRNNQFNALTPFVQIVDDLLTKTFHDYSGGQLLKNNVPGLNVSEFEKEIVLEVAAPGLEKKDFKIEIENNILLISADKKQESTVKNENYLKIEFNYHNFKRMYDLPMNVNLEQIAANYENGILSVRIPKIEIKKNSKTIEVI